MRLTEKQKAKVKRNNSIITAYNKEQGSKTMLIDDLASKHNISITQVYRILNLNKFTHNKEVRNA